MSKNEEAKMGQAQAWVMRDENKPVDRDTADIRTEASIAPKNQHS